MVQGMGPVTDRLSTHATSDSLVPEDTMQLVFPFPVPLPVQQYYIAPGPCLVPAPVPCSAKMP